MKGKKAWGYLIGGIVLIAGIYTAITYNGFVKSDEAVKLQWNEVQNNYQRRLNLVPALVNTVEGESEYEKNLLEAVTKARSSNEYKNKVSAGSYKAQTEVQNKMADAANSLIVRIENYPGLKSTRSFIDLQAQLEGTERRIKVARKDFNEAIRNYNTLVRKFPQKWIAGIFGFAPMDGFQSDTGADQAVEIKF